jgi:secondary thiamine-phosphate synthase enzyme
MRIIDVTTDRRTEFVDITSDVKRVIREEGLQDGAVLVYCPHTTAAVTVQENADPDVVHDILLWLNAHVPKDVSGFRHAEGNSDAHLKSSLVGPSVLIPVAGGDLVLGTWQGVYFCEFDGPRRREVRVQTIGNKS